MRRRTGARGLASWALGVLLLLAASTGAWAEEEGLPQRPFLPDPGMVNAWDTAVLEPGQVEILLGHTFGHADHFFDDRGQRQEGQFLRNHSTFLQATCGVVQDAARFVVLGDAHGVDFSQDPNGDGQPDRLAGHGLADAAAGVRWRFYQSQDETRAAALVATLALPTGPSAQVDRLGLSQEFASLTPRLVLNQSWNRWVGVVDVGYSLPLNRSALGARGGLSTVVGAGYQVGDSVKPLVELSYSNASFDEAPFSDNLALTGGLEILFSENAQAYVAVTRTLAGRNAPDQTRGTFFLLFSF